MKKKMTRKMTFSSSRRARTFLSGHGFNRADRGNVASTSFRADLRLPAVAGPHLRAVRSIQLSRDTGHESRITLSRYAGHAPKVNRVSIGN